FGGAKGAALAGNAGDMVADCLTYPLFPCRRAAAPTNIVRGPLPPRFPFNPHQSLPPLLCEHVVNRRHERCFRSDLTLPPTSRWRQGRELLLRIGQTLFQPCRLSLGINGRPHHEHPFTPFLGTDLQATSSRQLIALGHQDLFTAVIGPENAG